MGGLEIAALAGAVFGLGLWAGKWWGRVQMLTWLTVLLVHQPEATAKMLARVYGTRRAQRMRGAL